MALVTGIAKHIFLSFEKGVITSKKLSDSARTGTVKFQTLIRSQLGNKLLKEQVQRELKKIAVAGRVYTADSISSPAPVILPNITMQLTLMAGFGRTHVTSEEWDRVLSRDSEQDQG